MHDGRDDEEFSCPLCGVYVATMECIEDLPAMLRSGNENAMRLSHAVRCMQRGNPRPVLTSALAERSMDVPLPRPRQQANNLLRWMGASSHHTGEELMLDPSVLRSVIGAATDESFALVVNHLMETGLISGQDLSAMGEPGRASVMLTFAGWDRYEDVVRGGTVHGQAFMAMKYGRAELDVVVREHFAPHVRHAGFRLVRLDQDPRAGLIDNRMRVEIQNSDFVIADLSDQNPGAYWEAGYAEGLGKQVFYTCERTVFERDRTHFDTNHHYTVIWDIANPEAAALELKLAIRATLPHLAKMTDG